MAIRFLNYCTKTLEYDDTSLLQPNGEFAYTINDKLLCFFKYAENLAYIFILTKMQSFLQIMSCLSSTLGNTSACPSKNNRLFYFMQKR